MQYCIMIICFHCGSISPWRLLIVKGVHFHWHVSSSSAALPRHILNYLSLVFSLRELYSFGCHGELGMVALCVVMLSVNVIKTSADWVFQCLGDSLSPSPSQSLIATFVNAFSTTVIFKQQVAYVLSNKCTRKTYMWLKLTLRY
jgi:hypothetical protein